jgi:type VI secretion system VasD/TssJ family lipoprotein
MAVACKNFHRGGGVMHHRIRGKEEILREEFPHIWVMTGRNFRVAGVLVGLVLLVLLSACSSGSKAQGGGGQAQGGAAPGAATPSGPALTAQDQQLANLNLQVTRSYALGAIQINYRADSGLNLYEDKPHTLVFVVYQLNGVNGFNNLAKDADGLYKLLKAERFDATVMGVSKYFIEPGETKSLDVDRMENVKWVGLVAGYYNMAPGQVTRIFEVPVDIITTGKKKEARMGQLIINLFLGTDSLQEVTSQ